MFLTKIRFSGNYFRTMSKTLKEKSAKTVSGRIIENQVGSKEVLMTNDLNLKYEILVSPTKSQADKKDYTTIRLENGLTALLISDPRGSEKVRLRNLDSDSESGTEEESESGDEGSSSGSEKSFGSGGNKGQEEEKLAACALCVGAGSFSDPEEIPGLAHFLEHMVFMGSSKYPKENEFDSFIKKHGGSDNASTECEYTTFYFECQEEYLRRALDIFAQFFISPAMRREAMTREREAIESEFQMAIPLDAHRKQQLLSSTASEGNPVRKFVWGNLKTLRDNVEDDVLYENVHNFWRTHYSGDKMTLALQARLPTEVLRDLVVEAFSLVPRVPAAAPQPQSPLFTPDFTKIYFIEPIKDICELEVNFVMPSLTKLYRSKPDEVLAWLVGHEGKGSLVSYLRNRMWVLGATAGTGEDGTSNNQLFSLFSITITLTETGFHHFREILTAIFSYIKLLQNLGPQERIFNEMKATSDINFRFLEEAGASEVVEELVEAMQFFPPKEYITGSELLQEFRPEELTAFLGLMTPQAANICLSSKMVGQGRVLDRTEPWFGTRHAVQAVPGEWLAEWAAVQPYPEFHLPEPNPYIPTDFDLLPPPESPARYPDKVLSTQLLELWYKQDTKFSLPLAFFCFNFISPLPFQSPGHAVLFDLYVSVLKQVLEEDTYPAALARLSFNLARTDRGFTLVLHGYNQHLHLLLDTILNAASSLHSLVNQPLFDAMSRVQERLYVNSNLKIGYLGKQLRLKLLYQNYWTSCEKLAALKEINFIRFVEFSEQVFTKTYVQGLVQGNISKEKVVELGERVVAHLGIGALGGGEIPELRVGQLEPEDNALRVASFAPDPNSLTTIYYQLGPGGVRTNALLDLLVLMMEEPLFDQLRTQQQLGYDVSVTLRVTHGILGFSTKVVSQETKTSVDHVEGRLTSFLHSFLQSVASMTDTDIQQMIQALIKTKKLEDTLLQEEVYRNWDEIQHQEYVFDRNQRTVAELETVTKQELVKFVHDNILNNLRKLTVQVVGHHPTKQNSRKEDKQVLEIMGPSSGRDPCRFISNLEEFRSSLTYYPVSKLQ